MNNTEEKEPTKENVEPTKKNVITEKRAKTTKKKAKRKKKKPIGHTKNQCLLIGDIFQFVLAVSALGFGVAAYITLTDLHSVSHGIWAGLFLIITSSFAIKTGLTDENVTVRFHQAYYACGILSVTVILPVTILLCALEIKSNIILIPTTKIKGWQLYTTEIRNLPALVNDILLAAVCGLLVIIVATSLVYMRTAVVTIKGTIKSKPSEDGKNKIGCQIVLEMFGIVEKNRDTPYVHKASTETIKTNLGENMMHEPEETLQNARNFEKSMTPIDFV